MMTTKAIPTLDAGKGPGPTSELVRVTRLKKPFGKMLFQAQHCSCPARRTYGQTEREAAWKCLFYFQNPLLECVNAAAGLWMAVRDKELV